MSNRLSKGVVRAGSFAADTSGGLKFAADQAEFKVAVLAITDTGSTVERDTGFDLPAAAIVHDVWVKITTASSAGGTLHVGLLASESGGDADGFISSISTATSGTRRGTFATSTSGANGPFLISNTRGALLATFSSGSTGTGALGDAGLFAPKSHFTDIVTAKSVSWTANSSAASTGLIRGSIYIQYTQV